MANGSRDIGSILVGLLGKSFRSAGSPFQALSELIAGPSRALGALSTFEPGTPGDLNRALAAAGKESRFNPTNESFGGLNPSRLLESLSGGEAQAAQPKMSAEEQAAFNEGSLNAAKNAGKESFNQEVLGLPSKLAPSESESGGDNQGGGLLSRITSGLSGGFKGGLDAVLESQGVTSPTQRDFELLKEITKKSLDVKSEISKEERKEQSEFFNNILNPKPLSGADPTKLGLIDTGLTAIESIDAVFSQDPSVLQNMNRPGNPVGQQLSALRNELENSLLRIESGAAISNDEKKFVRLLTTPQGIRAFLQDPDTTKLKIELIKNKLNTAKTLMRPNNDLRAKVQTALKAGFSKDQIMQFVKSQGRA